MYQTHAEQSVNITDELVDEQSFHDPNGYVVLRRKYSYVLEVLFYESGIAIIVYFRGSGSRQWINFEVHVPPTYKNRTRGFFGNLDGEYSNEFHTRESLTPITLDSERQIYSHFNLHCKLIVYHKLLFYINYAITGRFNSMDDRSFFSLDRQRRQINEEFVPVFFDELNITEGVNQACEGSRQCILDLLITDDMDVAMDTLTTEIETNMTIDTISKTH